MRFRAHRSNKGASTIVLMLLLAVFVILPLGLLGFEFSRAFLIQQELRNVTDSAALSGTAAMASAPEQMGGVTTTYSQREQLAMTNALQTFQFNSILGTPFNLTNVSANQNPQPPQPQTPGLHQAILNILLFNQAGTQVALGTPASTITVQAYYTDAPIFASKILPIQTNFTLQAISNGGLPQLDVILCLDISGSMDDQTNIWLVNRYWDYTLATPAIAYNTAVTSGGISGHGNLFNVFVPPDTGTALNVAPPQNLSNASYQSAQDMTHPFLWSETPNAGTYVYSKLRGLRDNTSVSTYSTSTMPEAGMPPGNFVPGSPSVNGLSQAPTSQDSQGGFTDMVCDMTFPMTFMGCSFPNVQTAVEAARGNMESDAVLASACGCTIAKIPGYFPARQAGYFAAYQTWVMQNAAPIAQARSSAYNFFNTMNISSNCHFGLVCFSSSPGTSPTSVYSATNDNLDASYAPGGTGTFPNPMVTLNQANTSAMEFSAVTSALEGNPVNDPPVWAATTYPVSAEGSTDIADALSTALSQLSNTSDYRPGAKRAIVLFTDGVPNVPPPAATANTAALAQGTAAGAGNIPIYTIGLSQNPAIQSQENALLGTSGGIAGLSGNGAIYVPITTSSQLDAAFQTIARSLCVIQSN
jgi:hypothetical protein